MDNIKNAPKISSIQELLEELNKLDKSYSKWYRGQGASDWELVPGYIRLAEPPSESTLMKKFKQNATMLISSKPNNSYEWLFLMQHYGVPTRLLDWSESPLIALYFAVEDKKLFDEDGALWILNPTILNKNAGINDPDEHFFIPSFEDTELESYTVESLSQNSRSKLNPLATIATRNNTRIQAQHGVFTIHHNKTDSIENIGDGNHVIKFIIPARAKKDILNQLSLLGYSKFQLFPELASIGDVIKEDLK